MDDGSGGGGGGTGTDSGGGTARVEYAGILRDVEVRWPPLGCNGVGSSASGEARCLLVFWQGARRALPQTLAAQQPLQRCGACVGPVARPRPVLVSPMPAAPPSNPGVRAGAAACAA